MWSTLDRSRRAFSLCSGIVSSRTSCYAVGITFSRLLWLGLFWVEFLSPETILAIIASRLLEIPRNGNSIGFILLLSLKLCSNSWIYIFCVCWIYFCSFCNSFRCCSNSLLIRFCNHKGGGCFTFWHSFNHCLHNRLYSFFIWAFL